MIVKATQILILFAVLCFFNNVNFSQTTIAKQSFEVSGDSWTPITLSTPACNDGGNDIWDYVTSINSISPNEGSQFWGIKDLNGNCGGTGFESITFPNVDVSLYSSVTFEYDYNAFEFDTGDDFKYELFFDNVGQGEVVVVDGVSNLSTTGWETEVVTIPGTTTNVSVVLYARQNGGGDYGGFDNVVLKGTSTCTPPTISSVSPSTGSVGTTVTITASSGDLTGSSVSFNGVAGTVSSSNTTTIVCTVPAGATSGDITITDSQPCTATFSSFTVTCGAATEPTTNASTLNFSDVQCEELTFDWVNGNGANRIVVMSLSTISGNPMDQTNYIANSTFGNGGTIAAGEFVVYNGNSNTINVTGLSLNTNYFVKVFEYNGVTANCTENYLISAPLSGSQVTSSTCPTSPQIKSILVNACGADEGLNEYIVFQNGSNSLAVNDIRIDFSSAGSYCNTTCGTNTIIDNATYTNSLNTTASCSKFIYADPIPANTTVLIFTSSSPSYAYDFSSLCASGEQVVALYCNSTSTTGRFANSSSTVRSTTLTWGTDSQTADYIGTSTIGGDGAFADYDAAGNVTYSNNGDCIAAPLPAEIAFFESKLDNNSVKLIWQSLSEIDALDYELLKSKDGFNYKHLAYIKSQGNSINTINYSYIDNSLFEGYNYYQLNLINLNNKVDLMGYTSELYKDNSLIIKNLQNEWELNSSYNDGIVKLYSINGALIKSYHLNNNSLIISNLNLEKGIYILKINSNDNIISKKLIKD